MKLPTTNNAITFAGAIGILLSISMICGCSAADIQAVTNAVSALEQNKSLAEQFVRDVKGQFDPGDPQYERIMAQYEDSRDAYNQYISQVEGAAKTGRNLTSQSDDDVQQSAVKFISAATRSLDPHYDRSLSIESSITIPRNLPSSVAKLSNNSRQLLADRFGREMKWKSWSQLR